MIGTQIESVIGCFLYDLFTDPNKDQLLKVSGGRFSHSDFTHVRAVQQ